MSKSHPTIDINFTKGQLMEMSSTDKLLIYQMEKKSPSIALLYSLGIPIIPMGHIYTNNSKRGWDITKLELVSSGGFLLGCELFARFISNTDYDHTKISPSNIRYNSYWLTQILMISFELFKVADSKKQVEIHNKELYKYIFSSLETSIRPSYNGASLNLTYNF